MRILITGANGFIGRHCLPILEPYFDSIHAITRSVNADVQDKIEWHNTDLLDDDAVNKALYEIRPTHLIHLAWCTEHGRYWSDPVNQKWLSSGLHLLKSFEKYGGQRALIAGTCAEYSWNNRICLEASQPAPATYYGQCKNQLRINAESFASNNNLSLVWARLLFIFGPYEDERRLIPSTIHSLLKGQTAKCSSGNQIRDFFYVQDTASALVSALLSDLEGPVNICSGQKISIRQIVNLIADKLDAKHLVKFGALEDRPDDPNLLVGDNRILSQIIGFKPEFTLSQGIDRTIEWWTKQFKDSDSKFELSEKTN